MASDDPKRALNSYISDMIGVENHIAGAIEGQIKDMAGGLASELRAIHGLIKGHQAALERALQERGGDATIKKAGTTFTGWAIGVYDRVRNEGTPKNLRDDYTAASLAAIGYVMLHTTALALGDRAVGELALSHLQNYARVVMIIHNVIPSVVLDFLRAEGLASDQTVLEEVSRNLEKVWRSESGSVPSAAEARPVIGDTSGRR